MKRALLSLSGLIVLFLAFRSFAAEDTFKTITIKGEKGLTITADLYETGDKGKPFILLFHQAGSSRGEYRQIAPELVKMGFNCLAVDARSGAKDRWSSVENETALKASDLKLHTDYMDAYPDLKAAYKWVKNNEYTGKVILWGSSYSSTLVLRMGKEFQDEVSAVVAFSPGEYYQDKPGVVSGWAGKIKNIPVYIACGSEEKELCEPIFKSVPSASKTFYVPENGGHGSSILLEDEKNWQSIKEFLQSFPL